VVAAPDPVQKEFFPEEAPKLPPAVLAPLSPEEVELAATMPNGQHFARLLSWLRHNPRVVKAFMQETRAILKETPFGFVGIDEVLGRVRRRHGIKFANHKGFFARWLLRLRPELSARMVRRSSDFDSIMHKWEGLP
jgi:hypothetical protein